RCRRQVDGEEGEHEAVNDQARGQPADETHAALAEVLVDRVGHDEHDRPQQSAGGEVERAALAEQVPLPRTQAEGVLEREDLDSDEFGQHRVDAEERRQADEQARGAVVQRPLQARVPGTEKGMLSGETAPPEMMKLIAWSTVQSVGVMFSTGTISR